MKFVKLIGITFASVIAFSALSVPSANAVSFSYEGFTDFTPPGPPGTLPVEGTFDNLAAVLAQNEADLGLPAGSIQEIGKFNTGPGGVWDDGVFGSDALVSFTCLDSDANDDPCHSFTFEFDPTAESLVGNIPLSDWELVKIAMKIGNTGGEGAPDLPGHGFWVVGDGEINGNEITFDDFAAFGTDIDKKNGNSHIHFFGVQTTDTSVAEPGTLALLGIGLAGIGLMRRRRKVS